MKIILKDKWKSFRSCIFCSGTLKPIDAFAEIIGLENWIGKSFEIEFDKCKSIIVEGVSTKGEEMDSKDLNLYFKLIERFLEIDANIAIFSASYRVQDEILPKVLEVSSEIGRKVFIERQSMSGDESRKVLEGFKREGGVLIFGIQIGVISPLKGEK